MTKSTHSHKHWSDKAGHVIGTGEVSAAFGLHVIAYNQIRLGNLLGNLLKPVLAAA